MASNVDISDLMQVIDTKIKEAIDNIPKITFARIKAIHPAKKTALCETMFSNAPNYLQRNVILFNSSNLEHTYEAGDYGFLIPNDYYILPLLLEKAKSVEEDIVRGQGNCYVFIPVLQKEQYTSLKRGVVRLGDTVTVTIPAGALGPIPPQVGVPVYPVLPVVVDGAVITASLKVKVN